jgi:hypothetical protein
MDSIYKLCSLASKGTSQNIELPWLDDRRRWNHHGSPDLASPDGCCLWIRSYHLARLARDRHAAQAPCLGSVKNPPQNNLFDFQAQWQAGVSERGLTSEDALEVK